MRNGVCSQFSLRETEAKDYRLGGLNLDSLGINFRSVTPVRSPTETGVWHSGFHRCTCPLMVVGSRNFPMITSSAVSLRSPLRGLMFAAVTLALLPAWLCSAEAPVAVFTETFNDYQRTRLPDQSFKAETYAFGEGGTWGLDEPDAGVSKLTFMQVARAAALPLAKANYVPTPNPNETSLLILVYWGRTVGSNEVVGPSITAFAQPGGGGAKAGTSGMGAPIGARVDVPRGIAGGRTGGAPVRVEKYASVDTPRGIAGGATSISSELFDPNAGAIDGMIEQVTLEKPERDRIDNSNGRILGYSAAIQRARALPSMVLMRDAWDEVAGNRYYVVLLAFDFSTAWKEKKLKPLWSARISVEEDNNGLDKSLERMLATATRLFGQDSDGLRRDFVPDGRVTTGPLEVLDYLPPK